MDLEICYQQGIIKIMKFVYTQKFKKIMGYHPYNDEVETLVFSGFISKDGEYPQITDPEIIFRNKDWAQANNDYLAGFFGYSPSVNTGYVGKWSEDLERNAKIYYYIDGKNIREFIISHYNELGFTNDLDGFDYFINIDGKLMSAMMDPGDVIYDNYEEAKDQINNIKKYKILD